MLSTQFRRGANASLKRSVLKRLALITAGRTNMPKVFLSYARSDGSIVDKIAQDLKRNEIGVWDSQDLRSGQSWQPQIEKAINTADFMLLFLSPAILESKTVWHEYPRRCLTKTGAS